MKILAVVPARKGSKRLPGKNKKMFLGKPLISWSIETALSLQNIVDVLVTTDCEDIASIAIQSGGIAPWLRPSELSDDSAKSVDVCLHAISWYEANKCAVDALLLLQPTSPIRKKSRMLEGIKLFQSNSNTSVIGVSPAKSHPYMCYTLNELSMSPCLKEGSSIPSQQWPPAYVINGAFYLITPSELRRTRLFISGNTIPLVMDEPEESCDIDTIADWEYAEMLGKKMISGSSLNNQG